LWLVHMKFEHMTTLAVNNVDRRFAEGWLRVDEIVLNTACLCHCTYLCNAMHVSVGNGIIFRRYTAWQWTSADTPERRYNTFPREFSCLEEQFANAIEYLRRTYHTVDLLRRQQNCKLRLHHWTINEYDNNARTQIVSRSAERW